MSVIIGGRQSVLAQVPKELRDLFPRISKPLDNVQVDEMLSQSLKILQEPEMSGSHLLFCDMIRLILALQLSVAEGRFSSTVS